MKVFACKIAFIFSIFVVAISVRASPASTPSKLVYELGCRKSNVSLSDVENIVMGSFDKRIEIEDKRIIQIVSYYQGENCEAINRAHFRIGSIVPAEVQKNLQSNKNPKALFTDFILIKEGLLTPPAENLLMVEKIEKSSIDGLPVEVLSLGATFKSPAYYGSEPLPAWTAESHQIFVNDQGTQLQLMGTNYVLISK